MGYLSGLQAYLDENCQASVFDEAQASGLLLEMHLHKHRLIVARVLENLRYEIQAALEPEGLQELIHKTQIKLLYPKVLAERVRPGLKIDPKVQALGLQPMLSSHKRFHIKNKSLYPLMLDRHVVFFTLLEGEVVRGIVAGFSRYEITVHLKGGLPLTLLRHAIYDLRDKSGRCFLKSFQETHRDWEKGPLYISEPPRP